MHHFTRHKLRIPVTVLFALLAIGAAAAFDPGLAVALTVLGTLTTGATFFLVWLWDGI